MASAVIRVKRRITDEPFDKFVLNCKRQKICHDDENGANAINPTQNDDAKTILKLAATISADEDIKTHLNRLRKCDAEEIVQKVRKPTSNVINKLREQIKDDAQNARFKVVNCYRSIESDSHIESAEGVESQNITVVDVIKEESQSNANAVVDESSAAEPSLQDDKFVYDLYLVQSGEQPTEIDINNYTIRPFDDLIYQVNDDTLNDSDFDSEDSNDEANWRNDYPDTDDGNSVGEEDMRRAVEDLNFGSGDDNLSSDEEDYNYGDEPVHFIDANDESVENGYIHRIYDEHVRNHAAFYRSNRRNQRNIDDDDEDDSDIDDNPSSRSSASSVSPLQSCDENSD